MFKIRKDFFEKHALDCKQLVGICTDSAPSMIGHRSGFKGLVTSVAPHVSFTHFVNHRFALAIKTLPSDFKKCYKM